MTMARVGLTLGDPGGVGPEIIIKSLIKLKHLSRRTAFIIFGDMKFIELESERLGLPLEFDEWTGKGDFRPGYFVYNLKLKTLDVVRGRPAAENGRASFVFFEEAVRQAQQGLIQAIVTAPISKSAWSRAGIKWRGHTHYIEQHYPSAIMTFWSRKNRLALLSHHIPLIQAIRMISKERILDLIRELKKNLDDVGFPAAEFLIAGLNPHAGEEGTLGREEQTGVVPAIEAAKAEGINVSGPYPADTIFRLAREKPGSFVICLYHDQGLIGFKLMSFRIGVNVTLGLPFVRTSPAHGTAFDIAGQGRADPTSMKEAILLALNLVKRRII